LVVIVADPAVLVVRKNVVPPLLLVMDAAPAVQVTAGALCVQRSEPSGLVPPNWVTPPVAFLMVEFSAVLAPTKNVAPPPLLVINALPAELVSVNSVKPPEMLLILVAVFPAVLAFSKNVPFGPELDRVRLFEDLLTMPVPLIAKKFDVISNVYAEASALSCIVPMKVPAGNVSGVVGVVFDAPKKAVPVGTVAGVQFVAVSQSELSGGESQVAS